MLMGRARAMLIQAGIDSKGNGEFWCEVITDDQSRATKQEQANLCAVTVLCAST